MRKILKISRPLFWIYLIGPFLVGWAFGKNSFAEIDFTFLYSIFYFSLPANIFLYGINDLYDKDTDSLNIKKTKNETQFKDKDSKIYKTVILCGILLSLPLMLLSNLKSQIFLYLFLVLGFYYSAPPLRFKSKPILDFLANCLYALPAFFGYSLVTNSFPEKNVILAAILWTFAMHLFSAIPDITPDKKANITTTAVLIGRKSSFMLCSIFWAIAVILVVPYNIF